MKMLGNVNGGVEEKQERSERHQFKVHPYHLRAKTSRFVGYQESEEDRYENKSMALMEMDNNCDDHNRYSASSEEEDLANCLVLLSNKSCALSNKEEIIKAKQAEIKGTFQCNTCKKIFNSHQALGGHRASHKKVKGCFASKSNNHPNHNVIKHDLIVDMEDDVVLTTLESRSSNSKKRSKPVHECSVCRRVFSSGQALGGHKRCHWLTSASVGNAFMPNFNEFQYDPIQELHKKPASIPAGLDLNLPPCLLENTISRCEDSTRFYIQQRCNKTEVLNNIRKQNQHKNPSSVPDDRNNGNTSEIKLGDLRDVNLDDEGSSSWLQVGIASTADIH